MSAQAADFSTRVAAGEVTFRLPDASGAVAVARAWLDLDHHSVPPLMRRVPGGWEQATAVTGPVTLAGASLGALAALPAATAWPAAFGALFL